MKTSWIKGERIPVGTEDKKKGFIPRTGKNGGPIVKQEVIKVLTPR